MRGRRAPDRRPRAAGPRVGDAAARRADVLGAAAARGRRAAVAAAAAAGRAWRWPTARRGRRAAGARSSGPTTCWSTTGSSWRACWSERVETADGPGAPSSGSGINVSTTPRRAAGRDRGVAGHRGHGRPRPHRAAARTCWTPSPSATRWRRAPGADADRRCWRRTPSGATRSAAGSGCTCRAAGRCAGRPRGIAAGGALVVGTTHGRARRRPRRRRACTCACHDADVAINPKLLNEGERVVVTTRTHVKALFVPVAGAAASSASSTAFLAALHQPAGRRRRRAHRAPSRCGSSLARWPRPGACSSRS